MTTHSRRKINSNNKQQFLSVDNFKHIYDIFHKFLKEKYAFELHESNIDVKKILFETMHKISNDDNLSDYNIVDLNKVTLSIVKNVVKNKLSIDHKFNSSLIRDRDIEKKNVITHTFNRPVSTSERSSDLTKKFDIESNKRNSEITTIIDENMGPKSTSINTEDMALTDEEFQSKLVELEQIRKNDNEMDSNNSTISTETEQQHDTSLSVETFIPNQLMDSVLNSINDNIIPHLSSQDTNPKDLYESNNQFNESLVSALDKIKSTNNTFSKDFHEPLEKQQIILEEKYLLINSQDRNWLRDDKRYKYSIFFTNQSRQHNQEPFYENNPTIPHTKYTGGKGVPNLTGWVDYNTSTLYPKYDSTSSVGEIVGRETVDDIIEHNASVGNVFRNIHSIQVNKVIIPLNIFLLNKHNFNAASIQRI